MCERYASRIGFRGLSPFAIAAVALALTSCSSKGTIRGKVYYNDAPLSSGIVSFVAGTKTVGTGVIQPDGSYEIKNAPTGEVTVVVTPGTLTQSSKPGEKGKSDKSKSDKSKSPAIPPEYSDPAKSKEKYTITSGDQEYNIHLK